MRPGTWFLLFLAVAGIGVVLTPSLRGTAQGWLSSARPVSLDPQGDFDASVQACQGFALVDHRGWTEDMPDSDRYASADDALRHIDRCKDEGLASFDRGMLLSLRASAGERLNRPGWKDDLREAAAPLLKCTELLQGRDANAARECAVQRDHNEARL